MKQLIKLTPARGAPGAPPGAGGALASPDALAHAFASVSGDLALVLDREGTVLAAAEGDGGARAGGRWVQGWIGQAWIGCVAPDSQAKAARLLAEALAKGEAQGREINLAAHDGHPVGFRCNALQLAADGPVLVVGRDLGAQSALQQQLLALQREMERRYWEATARETTAR